MASSILIGGLGGFLLGTLLSLTSIFLILLVLVQRGRGGGLTGALGGMGGQSAFGAKAGDTFTYVTIGVAAFWIILAIASVRFLGTHQGVFGQASDNVLITPPETDGQGAGATGDGAGSATALPGSSGQTGGGDVQPSTSGGASTDAPPPTPPPGSSPTGTTDTSP